MGENGRNCECIEKDKLEKEQLGKKKVFKNYSDIFRNNCSLVKINN